MANSSNQIAFIRLNEDGSRDNGFAYGGLKFVNLRDVLNEKIIDLVADRQGRIISLIRTSSDELRLIRISPDGELDTSFSADGSRTILDQDSINFRITVDRLGRVVVGSTRTKPGFMSVGTVGPGLAPHHRNEHYVELRRYSVSGALDTSFGSTSQVVVGSPKGPDCRIEALQVTRHNEIIVGATVGYLDGGENTPTNTQTLDYAVLKFRESGAVATDFGTISGGNRSGAIVIPNPNSKWRLLEGIEVTAQGDRIICWGRENHAGSVWRGFIAAVTSNGDVDPRYADNGIKHFDPNELPIAVSASSDQKPFRRGVKVFSRLAILLNASTTGQRLVLLEEDGEEFREFSLNLVLDHRRATAIQLRKDRKVLLSGISGTDELFAGVIKVTANHVTDDPNFHAGQVFAEFTLNADTVDTFTGDGNALFFGRARPSVTISDLPNKQTVIASTVSFAAGNATNQPADPNDYAPPDIDQPE